MSSCSAESDNTSSIGPRLAFASTRPSLFAVVASGCFVCSSLTTRWSSIGPRTRLGTCPRATGLVANVITLSPASARLRRSRDNSSYLRTAPLRLSPWVDEVILFLMPSSRPREPRYSLREFFPHILCMALRDLANFTIQLRFVPTPKVNL